LNNTGNDFNTLSVIAASLDVFDVQSLNLGGTLTGAANVAFGNASGARLFSGSFGPFSAASLLVSSASTGTTVDLNARVTGQTSFVGAGSYSSINYANATAGTYAPIAATGAVALAQSGALQLPSISAATLSVSATGDLRIGGGSAPVEVFARDAMTLNGLNIFITGGSAQSASTVVKSDGSFTATAAGNFVIQSGNAADASASVLVRGAVDIKAANKISVTAGAANGSYALLDPLSDQPMSLQASEVTVTGGSGEGAYAAIVSDGNISIAANSLNLLAGTGVDADAVVISRFGTITPPTNCNGCVNLGLLPVNDGVATTGLFAANRAPVQNDVQSNQVIILTTQITQIETALDTAQTEPEKEERKREPEIAVEGQICP
jgi:hypothetical protein